MSHRGTDTPRRHYLHSRCLRASATITQLEKANPLQVFGPFEPEVRLGMSERVSPKSGCALKCLEECAWDPSSPWAEKCPKTVFLDTRKSLLGPGPKGSLEHSHKRPRQILLLGDALLGAWRTSSRRAKDCTGMRLSKHKALPLSPRIATAPIVTYRRRSWVRFHPRGLKPTLRNNLPDSKFQHFRN